MLGRLGRLFPMVGRLCRLAALIGGLRPFVAVLGGLVALLRSRLGLFLALDLVDHLAWPRLHLALEVLRPGLRPALPDGAAHLALDALDRGLVDMMLLDEPALHLLRDEARALPLDPVDRAAGDEAGSKDEEQSGGAKHPESLPDCDAERGACCSATSAAQQSRRAEVPDRGVDDLDRVQCRHRVPHPPQRSRDLDEA